MSTSSVQPPYEIFTDIDGQPLEDGYIWIGTAGLPAISNPITVYWNAALTIPAVQPIRTISGYPMNSGTPAVLYISASNYSILVQNKNGSSIYSSLNATERYSSALVTFLQAGANAVQRTAQAKMRDIVSVKDFGAVGDGVTDDTTAIQAAISANASVFFPDGTYLCSRLDLVSGSRIVGTGIGKSVIKLKPGANDDLIRGQNISGVEISGVTIDGNKSQNSFPSPNPFSGCNCVQLINCDDIKIFNSRLTNSLGNGARCVGCRDMYFESCEADLNYANGFYLVKTASTWAPANESCVRALFVDCVASQNGATGSSGAPFFEGFTVDPGASEVQYVNCRAETNHGAGFNVFSGQLEPTVIGDAKDVLYSNCKTKANEFGGFLLSGAKNVIYSGCMSDGDGTSASDPLRRASFCIVNTSETPGTSNVSYNGCLAANTNLDAFSAKGIAGGATNTISNVFFQSCVASSVASGSQGFVTDYASLVAFSGCAVLGSTHAFGINILSSNVSGAKIEACFIDSGSSGRIYDTGTGTSISMEAGGARYEYVPIYFNASPGNSPARTFAEVRNYTTASGTSEFRHSSPSGINRAYWGHNHNLQYSYFGVNGSNIVNVAGSGGALGVSFWPEQDGTTSLGKAAQRWSVLHAKDIVLSPASSATPANNGNLVIEATSNTSVTFKLKGSDGVVRSGAITLS